MDPISEIELEDCPVCRGAGYIEDEQGWCMYACCLNCGTETAHVSYKTPEERLEIIQEGVKDLQKTLDEIRKEKKA